MGTRTYSRRAADGTRRLTALGRARAGVVGQDLDIFGDPIPDVNPAPAPAPAVTGAVLVRGANRADWDSTVTAMRAVPLDRTLPNEQLVLLDDAYTVMSRTDGSRNAVSEMGIDPKVLQKTKWVTHNHPDSVSLSSADIENIVAQGRSGIEARCAPVTANQRARLNTHFTQIRDALVTAQQGKLSKQDRVHVDNMLEVVNAFLANPTATQWSFVAHNSDATPQFRAAGLIGNKINKRIMEIKNIGSVGTILSNAHRSASTDAERRAVRTAYTIVIQQAVLNDVLAGYPALTHGVVFE